MESFLLGIHQPTHELRSGLHRAETVCSERGGSSPTERSVRPVRVEPEHPLRRGDLDIINALPRTLVPYQLGLIKRVQRLSKGVIVRIASRPDRRDGVLLGQILAIANRPILDPAIRV